MIRLGGASGSSSTLRASGPDSNSGTEENYFLKGSTEFVIGSKFNSFLISFFTSI